MNGEKGKTAITASFKNLFKQTKIKNYIKLNKSQESQRKPIGKKI